MPARRDRPLVLAAFSVVVGLAIVQGCSSSGGAPDPAADGGDPDVASCAAVAADSCPTPTPSFETDVQPLVVKYCYGCHGPGGSEQGNHDFSTFRGFASEHLTVEFELRNCLMPLPDAGAMPSLAERETIMNWAAPCGAPNN